jgi:hypothetical protein
MYTGVSKEPAVSSISGGDAGGSSATSVQKYQTTSHHNTFQYTFKFILPPFS